MRLCKATKDGKRAPQSVESHACRLIIEPFETIAMSCYIEQSQGKIDGRPSEAPHFTKHCYGNYLWQARVT